MSDKNVLEQKDCMKDIESITIIHNNLGLKQTTEVFKAEDISDYYISPDKKTIQIVTIYGKLKTFINDKFEIKYKENN